MPLLSLPHLTMLDATPPQVVAAAATAGFDAVCLRLSPTMPGERQHPMIGNTPMMRETLKLLSDTGLEVLDIEAIWLKPDSRVEAYLPVFEAASKLGAKVIQIVAGDPDEGRLTHNFSAFCEAGASFGLGMGLEFMRFSEVRSLSQAQRIVQIASEPNGGLILDVLHFFRCGTTWDDLANLDQTRIHLIQLCDALQKAPADYEGMLHEARFNRRMPGQGELPLVDFMRRIHADLPMSVEVPLPKQTDVPSFERRAKLIYDGAISFMESMPPFSSTLSN